MNKVRIINVRKAIPVGETPLATTIFIHKEMEDICRTGRAIEDARRVYDEDSEALFNALISSLPGGTLDALFARLCEHKRSLFAIPWDIDRTDA